MNKTSIEWTHRPETRGATGGMTWNPIRARLKKNSLIHPATLRSGTFCTRISPGCTHCYASTINKRFGNGLEFTVPNLEKIEFFIDERILAEPLKQQKPCTIFVGDMFDLFHEAIPEDLVGQVILTMMRSAAQHHTFQLLTKRAARMQEMLSFAFSPGNAPEHIWLGVSVEDQPRADERIPLLRNTPAAVRFLSVEPQLEEVNLVDYLSPCRILNNPEPRISWVICGGESGHGARPFNLAWAESLLAQCRSADVPFFMKQIGSKPYDDTKPVGKNGDAYIYQPLPLTDRKGGDPAEWSESLRVREFPRPAVREAVSA